MNPGQAILSVLAVMTLSAVPALGQVAGLRESSNASAVSVAPAPSRPDAFGSNVTYYRISSTEFTGFSIVGYGGYGDTLLPNMVRYTSPTGGLLVSALHLPTGALLTGVYLFSCENNVGLATSLEIDDCDFLGNNCTAISSLLRTPNSGCGTQFESLTAANVTIDNFGHEYLVYVGTPAGDSTTALSGVLVGYVLQVSPAPSTASFVDVPTTSPIFKFVEALKASGITAGCDATHYCPGSPLTRGQMAVYLATALGLSWN